MKNTTLVLEFFNSLNDTYKLMIIGGLAIIVLAIIILVIVLIIKHSSKTYLKKIKRDLASTELTNKNQLDAYIKRLENIYKSNNELEEMFVSLNVRYEALLNSSIDNINEQYNSLEEEFNNVKRVNKQLDLKYKDYLKRVNDYKNEAKDIENEFLKFFKEGDELRVSLQSLQKKYQEVNDDVINYQSSLSICSDELNEYLKSIERKFELLEQLVNEGRYQEANKQYKTTDKMILNVYGQIETIAKYCKMVEEVIPNQLKELKEKNERLASEGYVVKFANVDEFISNTLNVLEQCKTDFKQFNFADFEEIANEFSNKLTEVNSNLDNEVSSKQSLEGKYQSMIELISKAESDFIKTKRQFENLKNYYKLPSELDDRFIRFENNATLLSSLKIEYDGYIFTNANHPASFMLGKVNTIEELLNYVVSDINYYSNYFNQVKAFVEQSYNRVIELSTNLIKSMGNVRYNKCKDVYDRYIEKESEALDKLKNISDLLVAKPIDIELLQVLLNNNMSVIEELYTSINNDLANYQTVEKSIIFANPLRHQFKDVDTLLKDIELLFKQGKYKDAQDKLNYILNNYHPQAFDTFKE